MRVLVCGSRTYGREVLEDGTLGREIPALGLVHDVLQGLYEYHSMGYLLTHDRHFTVISGLARGADEHARMWATTTGPHPGDVRDVEPDMCSVVFEGYQADWELYGKRAGPIRNKKMLLAQPDRCLAFIDKPLEDSRGTANMIGLCLGEGRIPSDVIEKARIYG